MKHGAPLAAGVLLALALVRPFVLQPAQTRLALELQDHAALRPADRRGDGMAAS
jgi:hypothetical protein